MKVRVMSALLIAVIMAVIGGCSAFNKESASPISPSAPPPIDRFVGTWTAGTGSVTPDKCSKLDYTIARTNASLATVTYDITCGGVNVKGGGSGALAGSSLKWTAWGNVSGEGIPSECRFTFVNNTATLEGNNAIRIDYSGTVCGMRVAGSQVLNRK